MFFVDTQGVLQSVVDALQTPLFTYGTISITGAYLIFAIVKFFVPTDKKLKEAIKENALLLKENEELKEQLAKDEERLTELENKVDVIVNNSQNRKIKALKNNKEDFDNAINEAKKVVKVVIKNGKE